MADFVTYQQVVEQFRTACNEHLAINQFGEGSIDRLDSLYQNALYPYAFLRPIQSTGMITNQNGVSGARSLNFEFYNKYVCVKDRNLKKCAGGNC